MPKKFLTLVPASVPKTDNKQKLISIPSGREGVRVTLGYMSGLVSTYKIHPTVRELTLKLIAGLPQKDYEGELKALFNYVKFHIRYVRDIRAVETVQTPVKTLEYGAGDCDDKSTLLATMLESIGFATRFRAMGFTGSFCHVIVEAQVAGKWVALDTTEPQDLGWLPDGIKQNMFQSNGLRSQIDAPQEGLGFITAIVGAVKGIADSEKGRKAASKKAKAQKVADFQAAQAAKKAEKQAGLIFGMDKKKVYIGGGVIAAAALLYYFKFKKKKRR